MRSLHPSELSEYPNIKNTDERPAFFKSVDMDFLNTLDAYEVTEKKPLHFRINKFVVETIVGDMFFHPDYVNLVPQTRALSMFTPPEDEN